MLPLRVIDSNTLHLLRHFSLPSWSTTWRLIGPNPSFRRHRGFRFLFLRRDKMSSSDLEKLRSRLQKSSGNDLSLNREFLKFAREHHLRESILVAQYGANFADKHASALGDERTPALFGNARRYHYFPFFGADPAAFLVVPFSVGCPRTIVYRSLGYTGSETCRRSSLFPPMASFFPWFV